MGENVLFGDSLTHLIYRVLMENSSELTASEIGNQVLILAQVSYSNAQKKQFLHRIRLRLKEMATLNAAIERREHKTDLNTIIYKYKTKS